MFKKSLLVFILLAFFCSGTSAGEVITACGKEWKVGPDNLDWYETEEWIDRLGNGWRVPSHQELVAFFAEVGSKTEIKLGHSAWADSKDATTAYGVLFEDRFVGYQPKKAKGLKHWAVAVRVGGKSSSFKGSTTQSPISPTTNKNLSSPPGQIDLSGQWICSDSGQYSIVQNGSTVTWEGEGPKHDHWHHRFQGNLNGDELRGSFQDLSDSITHRNGELVLKVINNDAFIKKSSTSIFGGSRWSRKSE